MQIHMKSTKGKDKTLGELTRRLGEETPKEEADVRRRAGK